MKNQLDVSVIVVNWNTCGLLRGCLQSVYEQTSKLRFEVIVVDNASTDDSLDMVHRLFPGVVLIANSTNKGYATAINQGIRISRGRYFLILNSDTVICDAAIEKTVAYANDRPRVAVVGCQVWKGADEIQPTCFRFPSCLNLFLATFALNKVFEKNRFFGREHMRWWRRDSEREVDVVSGMFMLVRGEAVKQVGLMDEAYFLLCEETDWCYRFKRAGWKIMFWPGARIIHVHGGMQSRKKANVKMMVQFNKSTLIFFRKHYTLIEYLLARFLIAARCAGRFLSWGLAASSNKLMRKDAAYATDKICGSWKSLVFCVTGCDPTIQDKKETISWLTTLKDITEFILALLYRMLCPLVSNPPGRVVIYYHGLRGEHLWKFERQMAYLAEHCQVVKASKIMTTPVNGSKVIVAVTFDDALVSFHDNAFPILRKYRLPVAIFVPTADLGKRPSWPLEDCSNEDEVVMDADQIAGLDKSGCEVLSHTVSHPCLTEIDDTRLEAELVQSRQALKRIVKHDIVGISYPYGAYNQRICEAAERAGYKFGFSVEPCSVDFSRDNFQIGRFLVSPTDRMLTFKLKVKGAYQVGRYLKVLKRTLIRT